MSPSDRDITDQLPPRDATLRVQFGLREMLAIAALVAVVLSFGMCLERRWSVGAIVSYLCVVPPFLLIWWEAARRAVKQHVETFGYRLVRFRYVLWNRGPFRKASADDVFQITISNDAGARHTGWARRRASSGKGERLEVKWEVPRS
jgi:hypothetical protein